MRLYIAGPITGMPDLNQPSFAQASEDLIAVGHTVYNPHDLTDIAPPEADWAWYMRQCLQMVLMADGVALLPGWRDSQGARLEQYVALSCKIPVEPMHHWLQLAHRR